VGDEIITDLTQSKLSEKLAPNGPAALKPSSNTSNNINSGNSLSPQANEQARDQCYKTFYARYIRISLNKLECLYLASLSDLVQGIIKG
jgi:hypothetical protein